MKIAFYGSSLLSSYWNGAATYYRGMLKELAALGHDITFYEPDAFDRQKHRDIDPPKWCSVVVYEASREAMVRAAGEAAAADVVVKASGVGYEDDALFDCLLDEAKPGATVIFWDVDAPATLAELAAAPDHPLHRQLQRVGMVLTYGGGDPVVYGYRALGVEHCIPVYNALDPSTHHPVAADERFAADLSFLGNRLPDREARVETFCLEVARVLPDKRFLLGGSGWGDKPMAQNVDYVGHVATRDHNAFNASPLAVLNISRQSMADTGFSPATRVFEAAGAAACLITDAWPGLEGFLEDGKEVLVARDGQDVAEILGWLTPTAARRIGALAKARVLKDHTYSRRAREVDALLRQAAQRQTTEAAE